MLSSLYCLLCLQATTLNSSKEKIMNQKIKQAHPNDHQAEQSVIGSLFNKETSLESLRCVASILEPSDFYSKKHTDIYNAIVELYSNNKPIDLILTESYLKNIFQMPYLDEIIEELELIYHAFDFYTPKLAAHYAYIVKEKALRRKTIRKLSELTSDSDNETLELDSIFDDILELEKEIKGLGNNGNKRKIETALEFMNRPKSKTPYIIEGILPASGFTTIAGFTGMGKSSLTMQLILSVLSGIKFINQFSVTPSDYHILYLNLENSEYTLDRLLKSQLQGICIEDDQLSRLYLPNCMAMSLDNKKDVNVISDWITEYHIEIVVIDPILDAFSGDQNDLTVVRSLIKKLREINSDISWILLHHFKKGGDEDDLIQLMLGSVGFANAMTSILGLRRFSRSVNPQYKKIEFAKTRDSALPEPIQVCMNNQTRLFEIVAGDLPKQTISHSLDSVIDILSEHGEMQYKDLATQIEFTLGISDRSAKNMIANALSLHKIDASNGIYRVAKKQIFPNYRESTTKY